MCHYGSSKPPHVALERFHWSELSKSGWIKTQVEAKKKPTGKSIGLNLFCQPELVEVYVDFSVSFCVDRYRIKLTHQSARQA